jgi:thioredoxin reductase (NADPH)
MIYDVIILGAGPAGLTAAIYAGRSRLRTLIIEKAQDGGQIAITNEIDNYPGAMAEGETGPSLVRRNDRTGCEIRVETRRDTVKERRIDGRDEKAYRQSTASTKSRA